MMTRLAAAFAVLSFAGSALADPVILSFDDIGDNYYSKEDLPENLMIATDWLGLYVNASGSRIAPTRVIAEPRREDSRTIYGIVTDPPNATLLFSGVTLVSPGPAVTAAEFMDLGSEHRETDIKLGLRVYKIRLESSREDLGDAVVYLSDGNITQKLFQSDFVDEPHFRIHWAGDLDRDGRLDLLATFSPKYSVFPRQLFLSSTAKKDELVAEAAVYVRTAQ